MTLNEIIAIASSIVLPLLSGIGSYFMAINKSKKDIIQLREQSKLEIERLMNQHKMDLEALERKHLMDIEKMEIEHKHKIELMQKEVENKVGGDFMNGIISNLLNTPEMKSQMNRAMLQEISKKKK